MESPIYILPDQSAMRSQPRINLVSVMCAFFIGGVFAGGSAAIPSYILVIKEVEISPFLLFGVDLS